MDNTNEVVKVLVIDTSKEPIHTEKFDISAANPALVKKTILSAINKHGKNSHALIKFRKKMFVADHTATRGESTDYHKTEVRYHPLADQLT